MSSLLGLLGKGFFVEMVLLVVSIKLLFFSQLDQLVKELYQLQQQSVQTVQGTDLGLVWFGLVLVTER